MRSTKLGCFKSYQVFGKLLMRRVHGLGSMAFELAVQKFFNIE
jgi:hypothetical protein